MYPLTRRLPLVLLLTALACQGTAPPETTAGTGGAGPNTARGSGGSPGTGGGSGGSPVMATGGTNATGGSSATGGISGTGGTPGTGGAPADSAAPEAATDASPPPAAGPSAGCGQMNMGGVFMITAGAATTNYRVVLPSNYDAKKPYPLIFYLHGRGNGIEGQGNLNRDVAAANLGIVIYPKSFGGTGWEVPGRDKPDENLALLRALIKEMGDKYCVDTKKVVMTGFSSGCWFASRLACAMKDELAGVVAAACGLDGMGRCMEQKPFTYIIGRGDQVFGQSAAAAEFYRTRNACQMTRKPTATAPCELYDGCGKPATFCVHPGGHMWPAFASKAVLEMLEKL
jgi:polyhydroxybutyrate depolymerase